MPIQLVYWLRGHSPLRFAGYDVYAPQLAIADLLNYVSTVDTSGASILARRYEKYSRRMLAPETYSAAPRQDRNHCRWELRLAVEQLLDCRGAYEAASSAVSFGRALQDARVALQAEEVFARPNARVRDKHMATNVMRLLQDGGSEQRMIVWGHNLHVGQFSFGHGYFSLGTLLRRYLGDALVTIGLTFSRGSVHALRARDRSSNNGELGVHDVGSPPAGSVEDVFEQSGVSPVLVDLRDPPRGAVERWLRRPQLMRMIGSAYDDSKPGRYFSPVCLQCAFDMLVNIQTSSPSHLLGV
jgi:erythromycin esterase